MTKYIKNICASSLIALAVIAPSTAETYKYHPGQHITLGAAYSPRSPFEDKGSLGYFQKLEKDTNSEISDKTFVSANFEMKEVQNVSELYDRMNFSAKAAARYGALSGKASLELANSLDFNENNVIYIFTGVIKFSPESTTGVIKINESGNLALSATLVKDPNNAIAFFNAAGSEIVTQISRGTSISIIYNFHATSKEQKTAMKASLDAKWAAGSANAKIEKIIKDIDRGASFTVTAYQSGGVLSDSSILSIIDKEPGNLPEIKKVVQAALEKTSRATSPIVEFTTTDVHSLPSILLSPVAYTIFTNQVDQLLLRQYSDMLLINRRIKMIEEFLRIADLTLLKPNARIEMSKELNKYNNLSNKVLQKSNDIIAASSILGLPTTQIEIPEWEPMKWIVDDYVSLGSWVETKSYGYTGNERGNTQGTFWPVIRFKFPSIISHAILRNGNTEILYLAPADISKINLKNGSFEEFYTVPWSVMQHYAWGGDVPKHSARFLGSYVPAERRKHENDRYSIEVFTYFGNSKKVEINNIYQDLKNMPAL